MKIFCRLSYLLIPFLFLGGCTSSKQISMVPATALQHDVFACKGLTEDNQWVGVTDQFSPDKDPQVVIVTLLAKQDSEARLFFEIRNPMNNIVFTESKPYPRERIIGIYYLMDNLMNRGGEGKWVATVYVDGEPIGQSVFYLGEKPKNEEEIKGQRYIVVEETENEKKVSLPVSEEERFANFIHEVSPELEIPASAVPLDATLNSIAPKPAPSAPVSP